jgi:hypothetical protein
VVLVVDELVEVVVVLVVEQYWYWPGVVQYW